MCDLLWYNFQLLYGKNITIATAKCVHERQEHLVGPMVALPTLDSLSLPYYHFALLKIFI